MGSGKTTLGRKLAYILQHQFIDLDEYIEEYEERSISQIFKDDGEDYFWYDGNNAQPTADGQCCDPCNQIVLADRITNLKMSLSKR